MATVVAYDTATGVAKVIAPDLYGQTQVDALPYRRNSNEAVRTLYPGDKVMLLHDQSSRSPMWFAGDGTHATTAQTAVNAGYADNAGFATNAGTLDGIDSTDFVRKTGDQTMAGSLTAPRFIPNTYAEASFPTGNYIGETMTATDTKRMFVWTGSAWEKVNEPLGTWSIASVYQGGFVPVSSSGVYTRIRGGLMLAAGRFTVNTATGGVAGNAIYVYPPITFSDGAQVWGGGYYYDGGNTHYVVSVFPALDSPTTQFNLTTSQFGDRFGIQPSFAMAQNDYLHIMILARV